MVDEDRIGQLRKLAEEDPDDQLAHFSLGTALLKAGRAEEAARFLQRVLALDSRHSKAYQMLGTAQKAAGHMDLARATLTNGYRVAHRNGDIVPMKAMAKLLEAMGAEVPTLGERKASAVADQDVDGAFACHRCGGSGPGLGQRPFKGELGERIQSMICQGCWDEWVGMGTKVINELRMPLHEPQAQQAYDRHMKEFLGLD
jgi:Fe-S cluster biosynthesis and repair protein YggX